MSPKQPKVEAKSRYPPWLVAVYGPHLTVVNCMRSEDRARRLAAKMPPAFPCEVYAPRETRARS